MTIGQEMESLRAKMAEGEKAAAVTVAALATMTAERDALAAKALEVEAAHAKVLADAKIEADKIAAALKAEQDAKAALVTELDTAKKILASPAYKDANAEGQKTPTAEGGTPSTETATFATKEEAEREYRKISDPKAQVEFRKQNKDILGL